MPSWKVGALPRRIAGVIERILVVDDDPDGAEMVADMLDVWGFETKFALDGSSAIALARSFVPQVILLDVSLPDIDGYEVARQLRSDPGLSTVVLVALTGWSGAERELKAQEAGFHDYLVKPIEPSALKHLLGSD